ncbi:MAG TPA: hypothetical protein VN451_01330, partial [Chitinophagaceae bacterium]|nr:hypothetical protein [Chitinophagaceae bacterium]
MLPYYVAVGLGYSIVIAAAIGLMRYKSILPAYRPFIYIILLGFLDHNLSVILNETIRNNAVNSNIYVLLESLLYIWFFKNLGGFFKKMTVFYFLFIFLIIVWGYDNLIRNNLSTTNSLFRIVYSFVLIFLSIEQLNKA